MLSFVNEAETIPIFEGGLHLLELFLKMTGDQRVNILLNHPSIRSFVYISDLTIAKAFFPRRVTDWRTNMAVIAMASDSLDVFMLVSIYDDVLVSYNLFLTEPFKLDKHVQTVSAYKFVKESKKHLPKLPQWASTEAFISSPSQSYCH